jgi:hypothetical protein
VDRAATELGRRIFDQIARKSSISSTEPVFVPGELGAFYLSYKEPRSVPFAAGATDQYTNRVYEATKKGKGAVASDARVVVGNIASGGGRSGGVELIQGLSVWLEALKDAAEDYIRDHTGGGAGEARVGGAGAGEAGALGGAGVGGAGAGEAGALGGAGEETGGDDLRRLSSANDHVVDGGSLDGVLAMGDGGRVGASGATDTPKSPSYSPTSPTNARNVGGSSGMLKTDEPGDNEVVLRRDWGMIKTVHPRNFLPGVNVDDEDAAWEEEETVPPGGPGRRVAAGDGGDGCEGGKA